jgi:LCP family protein required for cell wall assembly
MAGRDTPPSRGRRRVANEQRLMALGEAIDRRAGVNRPTRSTRRPATRRGGRGWRGWSNGQRIGVVALALAIVVGGVAGGGYLYAQYQFGKVTKISVANEVQPISGAPINILAIGSDSRVGLSGKEARQAGSGQVSGQRSDVVKIIHMDPTTGSISMISIPRDTIVSLVGNQSIYGNFNRINVNLIPSATNPVGDPSLLVKTIEANFGIPINYTVVVGFAGLINAAVALGGVYLNFPYASVDDFSGLRIMRPGCQLVTGFQALAIARSRHFYWLPHGRVTPATLPHNWDHSPNGAYSTLTSRGWLYDGTSDWGRILRQDAFLRALASRAKSTYNPLKLNSFLSALPQGIELDKSLTLNTLLSIGLRFHSLNPAAIHQYTLPTRSGASPVGNVLFPWEPDTQKLLVSVFGNQLIAPTNPPPNFSMHTPPPPYIPVTTTTVPKHHKHSVTTTTVASSVPGTDQASYYDPVPCSPK